MPFNPNEERLIIEGYLGEIEKSLAAEQVSLGDDVSRMLRSGVSAAQVRTFLAAEREAVLRRIASRVASAIREQLNGMTFASYWNDVRDESGWWRWVWEPSAKHCGTCGYRNGRVGTTAQMESTGVPRAGTTECRQGCQCDLHPIEEKEYLQGKANGLLITKNGGHPPGPKSGRGSRRAVSR